MGPAPLTIEHKASCEKVIEEDMERAFAVQRYVRGGELFHYSLS